VTLGEALPTVNALLNGTSAVLIGTGWRAIRRKKIALHRACMYGAFASSTIFLVCYLLRVYLTGTHKYPGSGFMKALYLAILSSHMLLAIAVVPLVLRTLFLARAARFPQHRKIARFTFPIWMYVSVTGVLVYLLLYQFV
jgi:putative membrane protein